MNPNLKFKKIVKNEKIPIIGESINDVTTLKQFHEINTNLYNIALVAQENNLIILDIDVKDDGLIEWNEYTSKHIDPFTVLEKTPSGGLHYYFIHNDPTYSEEHNNLISQLKQKNKYRGKGIDIKINSGYAVCEPSTFNNKPYKFIRHYNKYKFEKIPLTLLKWLLEFEIHNKQAINSQVCLIKDCDEFKTLLYSFRGVNSKQWLNITTATKHLLNEYNNLDSDEIKIIWDEWSQSEEGYNKMNNFKLWNTIDTDINFNYILSQIEGRKLLNSVKPYKVFYNEPTIKTIEMNNNYIFDETYTGEQMTNDIFNNYDTIIIRSTTGTGKTSNTAKFISYYNEKHCDKYKILSIINRISLVSQHQISFNNEGIEIMSYQDSDVDIEDDNVIICINSLLKYARYNKEFFNNYIVYVDEINSLLTSLTHNHLINDKLKPLYITLMKIINNCHKLIVSDATINDSIFNFLYNRIDDTKIYINNTFQKYKNVKAIHMKNENEFLKQMNHNIRNNSYFLFGSDSKGKATHYYNEALKITTKDKAKLKHSESDFIITDPNEQFKDKFIFYSPSITTGIDFTTDTPQDVFIYIKGNTLNPLDSFQQLTRTRNINNVYFYIKDTTPNQAVYNTLEETAAHYKNIALTYTRLSTNKKPVEDNLNDICINYINDELVFNENAFFKLFVYNEYIDDMFKTNKEAHFKQILKNNGFQIEEHGTVSRMDKGKLKEMKEIEGANNDIIFNEHINDIKPNKQLEQILSFLSVIDTPTAMKYKDILQDKFKRDDYFNLIRLFKKEEGIKKHLIKDKNNLTDYKAIYTNYYKVSLIWELESAMNIKRFNFQKQVNDKPFKIDDDLLKRINVAFRTDRNKKQPSTFNEYVDYYVHKIKALTGGIDIVISLRKQQNKVRIMHYETDKVKLNELLKLYELTDGGRVHIITSEYFDERPLNVNVSQKEDIECIDFIDELEMFTFPDKDGIDYGLIN